MGTGQPAAGAAPLDHRTRHGLARRMPTPPPASKRKASHFLAFVGIASTLVCHRRLTRQSGLPRPVLIHSLGGALIQAPFPDLVRAAGEMARLPCPRRRAGRVGRRALFRGAATPRRLQRPDGRTVGRGTAGLTDLLDRWPRRGRARDQRSGAKVSAGRPRLAQEPSSARHRGQRQRRHRQPAPAPERPSGPL